LYGAALPPRCYPFPQCQLATGTRRVRLYHTVFIRLYGVFALRSQYPAEMMGLLLDHVLSLPGVPARIPTHPSPFTTLIHTLRFLSRSHLKQLETATIRAVSRTLDNPDNDDTAAGIRMILIVASQCPAVSRIIAKDCLKFSKFVKPSCSSYQCLICVFFSQLHQLYLASCLPKASLLQRHHMRIM